MLSHFNPASDLQSLSSWFQRLSMEEPFAKAEQDVTKGMGIKMFKVCLVLLSRILL